MAEHAAADNLTGRRVLIVEDEYMIADDIVQTLARRGAEIVGPVPTVDQAMAVVRSDTSLDGAVLDINLRDEMIYAVADALVERHVPFLFATGYDAGAVPERYAQIVRCEKPFEPTTLASALARCLGPAAGAS